ESCAGLLGELDGVYGPELKTWVEANSKRLGEFDLLAGLKAGQFTLRDGVLKFRDRDYRPSEAARLLEEVQKELDEDQRYKRVLDGRVFRLHWQLANHLGRSDELALAERYRTHLVLQRLHQQIVQAGQDTQAALNYASGRRELSPEDFAGLRDLLRQSVWKLFDVLKEAGKVRLPQLKNMPAGQRLGDFPRQKEAVPALDPQAQRIDPEWIRLYLAQLGEVQDKLKRLLFKSLGGILATQEQVARDWAAKSTAAEPAAM